MIFVTGNRNKFLEAKRVIASLKQLDLDLPEIQELDSKKIVAAKLLEAGNHTREDIVVEDVSLSLRCLNCLPGPLIKWFLKSLGVDGIAGIAVSLGNSSAVASSVVGCMSDGKITFFESSVNGSIVSPRGNAGYGWDPIFQPEGSSRTYAEMAEDAEFVRSFRFGALSKLAEYCSNR